MRRSSQFGGGVIQTDRRACLAGECARGLQLASLETGVPIAFGVLTVETVDQALERAALNAGNKGGEAMDTALAMAALLKRL